MKILPYVFAASLVMAVLLMAIIAVWKDGQKERQLQALPLAREKATQSHWAPSDVVAASKAQIATPGP